MANWIVEDRLTGAVVHAYGAEHPDHFDMFPLEQYNHIAEKPVQPPPAQRDISGVSYLRRFTQAERIAIRNAAKQSMEIDDYLKLLDATIAQGGVVNLDDADTVGAVTILSDIGLIGPGRAAEILA